MSEETGTASVSITLDPDYTLQDLQDEAERCDLGNLGDVRELQEVMKAMVAQGIPEVWVLDAFRIGRDRAFAREFMTTAPGTLVWLYGDN